MISEKCTPHVLVEYELVVAGRCPQTLFAIGGRDRELLEMRVYMHVAGTKFSTKLGINYVMSAPQTNLSAQTSAQVIYPVTKLNY